MPFHVEEDAGKNPALVISNLCKKHIEENKQVVVLPLDSTSGVIVYELLKGEPYKVDAYDRIKIINRYNISEDELFEEIATLAAFDGTVIFEGLSKDPDNPIVKAVARALISDKCNTVVIK